MDSSCHFVSKCFFKLVHVSTKLQAWQRHVLTAPFRLHVNTYPMAPSSRGTVRCSSWRVSSSSLATSSCEQSQVASNYTPILASGKGWLPTRGLLSSTVVFPMYFVSNSQYTYYLCEGNTIVNRGRTQNSKIKIIFKLQQQNRKGKRKFRNFIMTHTYSSEPITRKVKLIRIM